MRIISIRNRKYSFMYKFLNLMHESIIFCLCVAYEILIAKLACLELANIIYSLITGCLYAFITTRIKISYTET